MSNDGGIQIRRADFNDQGDAESIVRLIDEYARIPVIGGAPLPDDVRRDLVPGLAAHPASVAWLARDAAAAADDGGSDEDDVGVLVAIGGYSTFKARPTLNVHDVAISARHRRRGIGTRLFRTAEAHAVRTGCAKLTLEVRRDNPGARALYKRLGFQAEGEDDETLFWEKPLP